MKELEELSLKEILNLNEFLIILNFYYEHPQRINFQIVDPNHIPKGPQESAFP